MSFKPFDQGTMRQMPFAVWKKEECGVSPKSELQQSNCTLEKASLATGLHLQEGQKRSMSEILFSKALRNERVHHHLHYLRI